MATKDFTKKREEISFTIGDDTFLAYPALAAQTLLDYAESLKGQNTEDATVLVAVYQKVLADLLQPESYERFLARMADKMDPIDPAQLESIVSWLFEEFGLRPTQPSETSSGGPSSPALGTGSTESTPVEVSISEPSLSIAS
jgi:hypothetical protein